MTKFKLLTVLLFSLFSLQTSFADEVAITPISSISPWSDSGLYSGAQVLQEPQVSTASLDLAPQIVIHTTEEYAKLPPNEKLPPQPTECDGWNCSRAETFQAPTLTTQFSEILSDSTVLPVSASSQTQSIQPEAVVATPEAPVASNSSNQNLKLSYADRFQRLINQGVGRRAGKRYCARAVRFILERAGFIPKGFSHRAASAKDFYSKYLRHLQTNKFVNDMRYCNVPGAIRVSGASKVQVPKRNRLSGDKHGDVEIVGTDGRYHSFSSWSRPNGARIGFDRRPLIGCYVLESEVKK